jgi:transcriptional repressor of dcmA and dcmR
VGVNESDLLDISEAAAMLRVSPASLRRWANAGRLRCVRIGGRRERRFRRADLLALLEREGAAAPIEAHRHLCGFYLSPSARAGLAADFLARGLAGGSACVLVAEPKVRDGVLAELETRGQQPRAEIKAGRLTVAAYATVASAQIDFWTDRFAAATRTGASSLRVVGDVSGGRLGRRGPFAKVLEYEREYERSVSSRFPVSTLCLYDPHRLSGLETAQLVAVHGDLFHEPVGGVVR